MAIVGLTSPLKSRKQEGDSPFRIWGQLIGAGISFFGQRKAKREANRREVIRDLQRKL